MMKCLGNATAAFLISRLRGSMVRNVRQADFDSDPLIVRETP